MSNIVTRNASDHRHDYRTGVYFAQNVPRNYQPRAGGPPLIIGTDARTTMLVNIALADGPVRLYKLWPTLGGRANHGLMNRLIQDGLVTTWKVGREGEGRGRGGRKYVALDPAHPAAPEMKRLLLRIAEMYPGYRTPLYEADDIDAGQPPYRKSRLRDVRATLADRNRTLPLLLVYIAGPISGAEISRTIPHICNRSVQAILWMFHAFGIIKKCKIKARGHKFELDASHPLAVEIEDILRALDKAMPIWRRVVEAQRESVPAVVRTSRTGTRKVGRWKW